MARNFEGTSTASLQAIHDGLVTYLSSGTVSAGLAGYSIDGRSVSKFSLGEAAEILNDVSNALAKRAQSPDGTEISYGGFADPSLGPANTSSSWMSP